MKIKAPSPKTLAISAVAAIGVYMVMRQAKAAPVISGELGYGTVGVEFVNPPANGTAGKSRGLRNNNPMNIKFYASNKWEGQVGNDGAFVKFSSMFYGLRAAGRLFRTYANNYGANTIRKIVTRWAPPSENDTNKYIAYVAGRSNLSPDKVLTRADYPDVATLMIAYENGENPLNYADIKSGIWAGFD